MSTQAHLDALKAKHKACETELADAIAHASASDQEIAEIKHRKLQLKPPSKLNFVQPAPDDVPARASRRSS